VDGPRLHIVASREAQRRRRRRRRIALRLMLVALATAAALVVVIADRGGGRTASARPHEAHAARRSAGSLAARDDRGSISTVAYLHIRRLIALGRPIYCAGPHGRAVAFTFDDGPGVYTHYAIAKLRRADAQATFFVVGRSVNNFPGYLPRELRVGAIGDHTYTHPDLVFLPPAEVERQLAQTARMITAQSGERVILWRPPYGADNTTIRRIARRLGLLEILWSIDSRDWFGASWSQIIATVEAQLRPGAIVLFHENHGQTIRALTTLLPFLHRRDFRAVTVPQLLASDPPSAAQVRRGWQGCSRAPAPLRRPGKT
jgi:peptidoglycan/xylan/chitin deacetylase (PgdA/CDA1 family)